MKAFTRLLASGVMAAQMFACASTTVINSEPQGAKLYIDGNMVGKTPYTYSDTKIVGSTTMVTLKKDGCQTTQASFSRSEQFEVGPCIGGVLVLVPFLWVMGYNPAHTFHLDCDGGSSKEDKEEAFLESNHGPRLAANEQVQCLNAF